MVNDVSAPMSSALAVDSIPKPSFRWKFM